MKLVERCARRIINLDSGRSLCYAPLGWKTMYPEHEYHREIISEIIRWMNQLPTTPLDTTLIAQHVGFSRWYMQRLFKQYTGITLGKYIRIVRLGNAAIELMRTESTVIDIAFQYGYESQQTFTRAMKGLTGLNPGAIKRMCCEDKKLYIKKIEKLITLSCY